MTPPARKHVHHRAGLSIRAGQGGDEAVLRAIQMTALAALAPAAYTPAQIAAWVKSAAEASYEEGALYVAEMGAPVGFAAAARGELHALYVLPRFWRAGVGSALLRATEAWAASQWPALDLRATLPAVPFYRHHGYQVVMPARIAVDPVLQADVMWMRRRFDAQPGSPG